MPSQKVDTVEVSIVPFDLVVIGAGINGLGIARDAASRGLRVAVIERDDFCSGVSAWSGRLIHGGLRYLEHGEVGLVRESLRERERLFRIAPHLVKPVPLLMPFYSRNRRPAWLIRLGMIAYDVLSWDKKSPRHRILSRDAVLKRFSGMEERGLKGAALFIDGQVEYAERLCVELAVAARADGAVIITHAEVTNLLVEDGQVYGVSYEDASTGAKTNILGTTVMNASGPWVDWVLGNPSDAQDNSGKDRLIGGSKGSHIVVDPFPGAPNDVVYYESQSDGRLVLVIPWMGRYLIGCTDTKFDDGPDSARATRAEADYLLAEVNVLIPDAKLTIGDVLFTYSGVRPLPFAPGVAEWKIPRSHIIHDHKKEGVKNLYSVVSGKLTTYRQLAEDAVNIVFRDLGRRRLPSPTRDLPFPGARVSDYNTFRRAFLKTSLVDAATAERLLDLYGVRAEEVLELMRVDPQLGERFDPLSDAVAAELIFAVRSELAHTLTDVLARRILLAFEPDHGVAAVARAAAILAPLLGWNDEKRDAEIADYREWLGHLAVPGRSRPVAVPAVDRPERVT
ncbi:glycerol-3-phosphate dehydrogenase/oxidase [Salinibacterium sp.]|uniref:glycerol-3-phosphate dehydrogenase/oxidase n=1 Tax=Salinibacterium sp. TaxID=1915057 RepID=UPI00286C3A69|nr:glycerol-3-phosphate dehydrogenase/oxidase [Salinibacterium sp.]